MQERFAKRESRKEDVDEIERLKRQMKEKDEMVRRMVQPHTAGHLSRLCLPPLQVRRTYEEMKYFKMELQNREENFNSTFKSQPRVGTLNPLAGKASASSKDLSAATHALRGGISQVSQLAAGANAFAGAIGGVGNGGSGVSSPAATGAVAGRRRRASDGAKIAAAGDATAMMLPPADGAAYAAKPGSGAPMGRRGSGAPTAGRRASSGDAASLR